ncbi:MAG: DinB family protein [Ignavibacteriae bacterium]|nr:DinB family protein [Ignavibacteriota bacterium]
MTLTNINTLIDFDKWATNRILDIVATVPQDQYAKNLNSSHGGIRGTLVHTYSSDWVWLERWKGVSPTAPLKEEDYPDFPFLKSKWDTLRAERDAFIASLTEQKLKEPLSYKDIRGNPYTQPLWHLIQHVVNHSTYHRGQVVTMLRQINVKPVATDLVAYYRQLK